MLMISPENSMKTDSWWRHDFGQPRVISIAFALFMTLLLAGAAGAAQDRQSTVYATVGDHQITQRDVDDAIISGVGPAELYDLRKQSLDKLVDDYLVEQAARKEGVTPQQYLATHTKHDSATEADARKFYDQHKTEIAAQTKGQTFDQLKGRIIAMLDRSATRKSHEDLMARLRSDNKVNVTLTPPRFKVDAANHPWSGGKDAPVTVVEFSDFQCPYCRAAETGVKQMRTKYGNRIKFVYEDFPLGFHEHAMDAARAARCAGEQDKFWPYHDALFADQSKLTAPDLKSKAAKLGLDNKKFAACFDKQTPDVAIKADQTQGASLGVSGTPTFFVNGRELTGVQSPDKFDTAIDEELAASAAPAQQVSKTN
jgi:protein-disulfide isomerase